MHYRLTLISIITVLLAADSFAVTYLQIFEVPAPRMAAFDNDKPEKKGLFSSKRNSRSKPENQMLLSERYSKTSEGSRRLQRTSKKYDNETYRIRVYKCPAVLARSNKSNTEVVIDVSNQRVFLLVDNMIGLEAPISTARAGKSTPTGTFSITERVRSGKISTLYDVEMPFWMRLNQTVYGVHAGYLPGYPASAGCVRLPMVAAETIYNNTRSGSKVHIRHSWSPSSLAPSAGRVAEVEVQKEAEPVEDSEADGAKPFFAFLSGGN